MTLREARIEKRMSQVDACKAVGVSLNTYTMWERGAGGASPENAERIRSVFGEVDELRRNGGG